MTLRRGRLMACEFFVFKEKYSVQVHALLHPTLTASAWQQELLWTALKSESVLGDQRAHVNKVNASPCAATLPSVPFLSGVRLQLNSVHA